ncbi:MAG: BON domain-containing protein [Pseudomonadota bacterium]|nr:BON domain-containing protein [Pseudomonadota bacterium]
MKTLETARGSRSPRTDAKIARDVETGLSRCMCEPTGAVTVTVEAGWVTLSGVVETPLHKQAAADSLRYLLGVTGVSDHIEIQGHGVDGFLEGPVR